MQQAHLKVANHQRPAGARQLQRQRDVSLVKALKVTEDEHGAKAAVVLVAVDVEPAVPLTAAQVRPALLQVVEPTLWEVFRIDIGVPKDVERGVGEPEAKRQLVAQDGAFSSTCCAILDSGSTILLKAALAGHFSADRTSLTAPGSITSPSAFRFLQRASGKLWIWLQAGAHCRAQRRWMQPWNQAAFTLAILAMARWMVKLLLSWKANSEALPSWQLCRNLAISRHSSPDSASHTPPMSKREGK